MADDVTQLSGTWNSLSLTRRGGRSGVLCELTAPARWSRTSRTTRGQLETKQRRSGAPPAMLRGGAAEGNHRGVRSRARAACGRGRGFWYRVVCLKALEATGYLQNSSERQELILWSEHFSFWSVWGRLGAGGAAIRLNSGSDCSQMFCICGQSLVNFFKITIT